MSAHKTLRIAAAVALPALALTAPAAAVAAAPGEDIPVVLLHGLARSPASMETLRYALEREGFRVCNIGYPSRHHPIAQLARDHVAPAVQRCAGGADRPVHFVTHSMGGIVVRELAATGAAPGIRRVVMLAPPNQGSELIDGFGALAAFTKVGGPAGRELGTTPGSTPLRLGAPAFELGVIAGTRSLNPLLSLHIPGPDDGKVAVARTHLAGARDFIALPVSHPAILVSGSAIAQTVCFLRTGTFDHPE